MKNVNFFSEKRSLWLHKISDKLLMVGLFSMAILILPQTVSATIIGPSSASTAGTNACAAAAGTSIQSVAADIAMIDTLWSSDCSNDITVTLINESLSSTSTNCGWEYFRNYSINENAGANCDDEITVTVEHYGSDQSAPTGSYGPISGINSCISAAPGFDMAAVAAAYSDNCFSTVDVFLTNTTTTGDDCGWTVTFTFDVADDCSNTLTGATYSVSGSDMSAPTGSSTAGTTGTNACLADAPGLFTFDGAAALNGFSDCSGVAIVTGSDVETVSGTDCAWTLTYTFLVEDGCGTTTSGSYTHTGGDNNAPSLSGSAYSPVPVDACFSAAAGLFAFDATKAIMGYTDDCNNVTATETGTEVLTGDDCNWTITYTYQLMDDCGNILPGMTYTETGSDMTDPTVVTQAPATPYVVSAASCDITVNASTIDNGSSDNCSSVIGISKTGVAGDAGTFGSPTASVTLVDGTDYNLATMTACPTSSSVYLHVIDQCGAETISASVPVQITIPAGSVSFPAYADRTENTVASDCNQDVIIDFPVVTTLCGSTTTPSITAGGIPFSVVNGNQWLGDFPLGTTSVTVTAVDLCGNSFSNNFNVTIVDNVDPAVNFCPTAPAVLSTTSTTCDVSYSYFDATGEDNCGLNSTTPLEVTFSDGSGGAATPAAYPSSYVVSATAGNQQTATFAKGNTLITFTFLDANGNSNSSCTMNVEVADNTAPTVASTLGPVNLTTSDPAVTCPAAGVSLSTGALTFGASFTVGGKSFTAPVATDFADNCPVSDGVLAVKSITNNPANSNCWTEYDIEWEYTDCGGNTVTHNQIYDVTDNTPPSLTGTLPNNSASPVDACIPTTPSSYFDATVVSNYTDDCQSPSIINQSSAVDAGSTNCMWSVTHTFEVTDNCGNVLASQSYQTFGEDKTAPTGTAPMGTANNNTCKPTNAGAQTLYFDDATVLAGYTDACGGALSIDNKVTNVTGTDCAWTATHTYDVVDACNNVMTSETFSDTGGDTAAPTAVTTPPATYFVTSTSCDVTVNATDIDGGSADNCSFVIGVSKTGIAGDAGTFAAPIASITLVDGVDYDLSTIIACPAGDMVYLHVIDACGAETISAAVNVGISTPPGSVSFPDYADVTANIVGTDCNQDVLIDQPVVSKFCGISSTSTIVGVPQTAGLPNVSFSLVGNQWLGDFPLGVTDVTVTVVDLCGNSDVDAFTVTIIDPVNPNVTFCPAGPTASVPTTMTTCDVSYTYFDATGDDNCSLDVSAPLTVSFSDGSPSYTVSGSAGNQQTRTFAKGTTTVTFTFLDGSGNTNNSCSFDITVVDSTPPTVANPAADEILLTSSADVTGCPVDGPNLMVGPWVFGQAFSVAGKSFAAPVRVDFADNCPEGELAVLSVTPGGGNPDCESTYTVVWEFTDCGDLTVTDVQIFTVEDKEAPVFSAASAYMPTAMNACQPTAATAPAFDSAKAMMGYTDACGTVAVTQVGAAVITGDNCSWVVTYTYDVSDGCAGNVLTNQTYTEIGGDMTSPALMGTAYAGTSIDACKPTIAQANALYAFDPVKARMGYTDNCVAAAALTATMTAGPDITGTDCNWEVEYTYTLSDGCAANDVMGLTYKEIGGDMTAPVGAAPAGTANINACLPTQAEADQMLVDYLSTIIAGYSDVCSGPTTAAQIVDRVSTVAGNNCAWTVTHTYSVEDACGIKLTGQTYMDSGASMTPPTIAQPQPDQTVNAVTTACTQQVDILMSMGNTAQCGGDVTLTAAGIDATGNAISLSPDFGGPGIAPHWTGLFPLGTSTVTITATDPCGLTSTDVVDITVINVSPPTFSSGCPANISIVNDPLTSTCNNPETFTIPTDVMDNCGSTVFVDVAFAGTAIPPSNRMNLSPGATVTDSYFAGVTTVTLTARNQTGLTASCSFTVTTDAACTTSAPTPCEANIEVVTDDILTGGPLAVFKSDGLTQSDDASDTPLPARNFTVYPTSAGNSGTVIMNGERIAFYGGTAVLLNPGFDAQLGSIFLADIAPCASVLTGNPVNGAQQNPSTDNENNELNEEDEGSK